MHVPGLSGFSADTIDDLIFAAMVMLGLGLSHTRVGKPLAWAETFYHELSHGIICILTGGKIDHITLSFNGAGCCYTRGGWRIPTLLAGYAGSALWGGVLFMAGWLLGDHGATTWLKVELGVMAFVLVVWARDWRTWVILLTLGGFYGAAVLIRDVHYMPLILQFMGIYVLLNAIRAPLFLIDGQHVGDGAMLADIFHILPEGIWIALWFAFALLVMGVCMYLTLPDFKAVAEPVLVWAGVI